MKRYAGKNFQKSWFFRLTAKVGLGKLNDPEPEKKNYLKEKPELAAHLLALHNKWAKDVKPKHRGEGK